MHCGRCGRPYSSQSAKSGRFAYYVCSKLLREGAGTCDSPYLNAERLENVIVENIMTRILNDQTITELVQLVAEEIDAVAEDQAAHLALLRRISTVFAGASPNSTTHLRTAT